MSNRKTQNTIAAIIIILALLLLVFQDQIWDLVDEFRLRNDGRPIVAKLEYTTRQVKMRAPETLIYRKARTGQNLRPKDTVMTDMDSTAVLSFKSGLKVELQPNSLIIIEDYGSGSEGSLELSFLRGGIRVLNETPGVKVKIKGDAVEKEAALNLDLVAPAPTPPPPPPKLGLEDKKEAKKALIRKKRQDKETLPDNYIAGVIRGQKAFLNRCYAQHLRLNPDARGRIDTSITIEPDGSVSTTRILGSTIGDPTLQQCVVSTLQRARFRAFNGDPIIVNYPINFE